MTAHKSPSGSSASGTRIILDDKQIGEIRRLSMLGVSNRDIAFVMGCNDDTFRRLRKRDDRVEEALYRGRIEQNTRVAQALVTNAVEHMNVQAQTFYLRSRAGWDDKPKAIEESPPIVNITFHTKTDMGNQVEELNIIAKKPNDTTEDTDDYDDDSPSK